MGYSPDKNVATARLIYLSRRAPPTASWRQLRTPPGQQAPRNALPQYLRDGTMSFVATVDRGGVNYEPNSSAVPTPGQKKKLRRNGHGQLTGNPLRAPIISRRLGLTTPARKSLSACWTPGAKRDRPHPHSTISSGSLRNNAQAHQGLA